MEAVSSAENQRSSNNDLPVVNAMELIIKQPGTATCQSLNCLEDSKTTPY
jgi:hypothetical protein